MSGPPSEQQPLDAPPHFTASVERWGGTIYRRTIVGLLPVARVAQHSPMSAAELARMLDRGAQAEPELDPMRQRWLMVQRAGKCGS